MPGLFFFIFVFSIHSWQYIKKCSINFCWWLDSNRGPLVSEASVLPTEPQPLPRPRNYTWVAVCSQRPRNYLSCCVGGANRRISFFLLSILDLSIDNISQPIHVLINLSFDLSTYLSINYTYFFTSISLSIWCVLWVTDWPNTVCLRHCFKIKLNRLKQKMVIPINQIIVE